MPEPTGIELTATNERSFKTFKNSVGIFQFKVKTFSCGLDIALFTVTDNINQNSPTYIIKLGHSPNIRSKIAIEKKQIKDKSNCVKAPNILSHKEFRGFWITWTTGTISVGRAGEALPIIHWKDPSFIPVKSVGIRIHKHYSFRDNDDNGAFRHGMAEWIIEPSRVPKDSDVKPEPTGVHWVAARQGEIPPKALIGGEDNGQPMYVARCLVQYALTPGKLIPGNPYVLVSWDSREHTVEDYEVLCNFDGVWEKGCDDNIPQTALLAGRTEDDFPLYIGRVTHNGTLTVGKVQLNHKCLYIPYDGQEVCFNEYEILCHPPAVPLLHQPSLKSEEVTPTAKWVYSCNGRVPRNAFIGGHFNGEPVIVIRATVENFVSPGSLIPSKGAFVTWGGRARHMDEYEVLCDFRGTWEEVNRGYLPSNAVEGGEHSAGYIVYIARAKMQDNIVCGRAEPPHHTSYIPFGNIELSYQEFEVLCFPKKPRRNLLNS